MSPIDQKTRPLKENHLIQRVLHRPVELAPSCGKRNCRAERLCITHCGLSDYSSMSFAKSGT